MEKWNRVVLIILLILILLVIGIELIYKNTIQECCSPCKDSNSSFSIYPTVCAPCNRNIIEKVQVLFKEFFK